MTWRVADGPSVYLASVSAGYSSSGMIAGTGDLGEAALSPDDEGHWKLDDDKINALRSGGVNNDLRVSAYISDSLVGHSWHRSSCHVTWTTGTSDEDCMMSTRSGPEATDYTVSGHAGALTRWYVDGSFGYILPHTHLDPSPAVPTTAVAHPTRTAPSTTPVRVLSPQSSMSGSTEGQHDASTSASSYARAVTRSSGSRVD